MAFSASRLTCYALLSALEEDMRAALVEALPGADPYTVVPADIAAEARRRMSRQQEPEADTGLAKVLPFVDFGDALGLLNRHKDNLPGPFKTELKTWQPSLQRLIPIRNRVAHTRPLEINDLPFVQDLSRGLARHRSAWPTVDDTLTRLSTDPSFVLNLDIRFADVEPEVKRHNLPLPDFDDTGLLGRATAEKSLLQMLRGPFPVISLVGDGGLGKTALAVKAAYALLDDPKHAFDAIVWTTAKAAQLTNTEVVRIEGAIRDSLGMFDAAARELAGSVGVEDPLSEVLSYMESFRILLILDNLETVLDARLRDFLARLPRDSKVLITSRIGLGSMELPLKLGRLEVEDGAALLRATAKSRGLEVLSRAEQEVLRKFTQRMKGHPLYIKWFVSVVQAGSRPEDVLADSGDFLDFCMSNVYEYLNESSRAALRCLQGLPGRHSQAELSELTKMPVDELQGALAQLITTNFVNLQPVARGGALSSEYEVTEFAQVYLDRRHPLGRLQRTELAEQYDRLLQQGVRLANASVADPYAERSLNVGGGPGDVSIASRLLTALSRDDRGESGEALGMVREAQLLAPEYYESYRVEAMLQDKAGDIGRAVDAYERALEHADGDASCLYHAARFFLRRAADPQRGLALLQEAARSRRDDPILQLEIVRGHLQCGNPDSALDGALGLLRGSTSAVRRDACALALRAATQAAQKCLECDDANRALERLEELVDVVLPLVDLSDPTQQARFVQARALVDRVSTSTADAYLRRSAVRLAERMSEQTAHAADLRYARVVRLRTDKGFGFLKVSGVQDLFFGRHTVVPTGTFDHLSVGDEVCYQEGRDREGRPCAVRVLPLADGD